MFSKKFNASGLAIIKANDSGVVSKKSGIEKSCFFFLFEGTSEVLFSTLH